MSREKQIEEMARTLCGADRECRECYVCGGNCEFWIEASVLYNAGYRKQSEGEWIYNTDDFTPHHRCSICGYNKPIAAGEGINQEPKNYCPNCGAKMKGGAER